MVLKVRMHLTDSSVSSFAIDTSFVNQKIHLSRNLFLFEHNSNVLADPEHTLCFPHPEDWQIEPV